MKELNNEQFKQYLLNHGVTWAITMEDHEDVPKETKLAFIYSNDSISSFECDTNESLNLPFDYEFFWNNYTGLFRVIEDYPDEHYEFLKPGDLVDISPNLVNHPDFKNWDKGKEKMAGKKGLEIREINRGSYDVYTENKNNWCYIPMIYVKPHIPEEVDEETEWKELREKHSLESIKKALKDQTKDY